METINDNTLYNKCNILVFKRKKRRKLERIEGEGNQKDIRFKWDISPCFIDLFSGIENSTNLIISITSTFAVFLPLGSEPYIIGK